MSGLRKQIVNFPLAALLITVAGAIGTYTIVDVAESADLYGYEETLPQQESGEVPTISEALEGTDAQ